LLSVYLTFLLFYVHLKRILSGLCVGKGLGIFPHSVLCRISFVHQIKEIFLLDHASCCECLRFDFLSIFFFTILVGSGFFKSPLASASFCD
jgi:hypothetical protein